MQLELADNIEQYYINVPTKWGIKRIRRDIVAQMPEPAQRYIMNWNRENGLSAPMVEATDTSFYEMFDVPGYEQPAPSNDGTDWASIFQNINQGGSVPTTTGGAPGEKFSLTVEPDPKPWYARPSVLIPVGVLALGTVYLATRK